MIYSSPRYRAFLAALVAGSFLIGTAASAVEVFTTPEARKQWEERQAADLKVRKEQDRADKAHKRAAKDAETAGMQAPAVPPPASAAGTIHGATAEPGSSASLPNSAKPAAGAAATTNAAGSAASSSTSQPAAKSAAGQAKPAVTAENGASKWGWLHLKSKPEGAAPMAAQTKSDTNAANSKIKSDAARKAEAQPKADSTKTRAGRAPTLAWINPDVEPKAVLLCVHGLGLHNKSYEEFGKRMAAAGIATYAVDVRGFGSWMNTQANQDIDFEYCLFDVKKTLEVLHKVHPGLPVFLLGESMGGAIAMRATAMYPDLIDGLISCVPAGDRFKQGRTELRVAFHLLHPNKQFDIGHSVVAQASESKSGGHDNDELKEQWLGDDLNRKLLSPKELIQFQRFMNENHEWAKKIYERPVLMMQGGDDALVKATGTLELLNNIPVQNRDVYLIVIRDAKHLIFEESQSNDQQFNNKVLRLVNGWIDDHLKRPQTATTQAVPTP
ncbi:MAG TPA: alpha/beta fold hydrolase [Candidatus Obscuribacterales bacterium]